LSGTEQPVIFLIFVATFVTLACLVVPLAILTAFAVANPEGAPADRGPREDEIGRRPVAIDEWRLAEREALETARRPPHPAVVTRQSSVAHGAARRW
jgi:hypothetical protein